MTESSLSLCRALAIGAVLALLLSPQNGFSEDDAHPPHPAVTEQQPSPKKHDQAKSPDASAQADRLPSPSTTNHTITLAGTTFPYTSTAGTIPLHNAQGKTLANVFYVAYTREPQDAKRPVTFVFNGGPGAASAYLHLGAIGPRAIDVNAKGEVMGPPPRLVDNDSSWLDFTDLVFVDPVGTGFSRVIEPEPKGGDA